MKKYFIILMAFISFSTPARVVVNKGPAFLINTGLIGTFSQDKLVALYASWNDALERVNNSLRTEVSRKFKNKKIKEPLDLSSNFLSFGYHGLYNEYKSWGSISTKFGYCHGMTMVTRQMIYYSHFRPDLELNITYEKNPQSWMNYYKRIIDNIMNGIPQEIPGFKNLADFASSPMKSYIQTHIMDQWALNTATKTMLLNVSKYTFKPLDKKTILKYKKDLSYYLENNFFPRVVLGPKDFDLSNPHVVMITELHEDNDKCLNFNYYNVGANEGGSFEKTRYCVGDYLWLPEEEKNYFMDFSNSTL